MTVPARDYKSTAKVTQLAADITDGDLTFTVSSGDGDGHPDGTDGSFIEFLSADNSHFELILCDSRTGDIFNVNVDGRGWDDTVAQAHQAGDSVVHSSSADDYRTFRRHITTTTDDDHIQYMKANGIRHDTTARHPLGTVVPLGIDGNVQPIGGAGDSGTAALGAAAVDHVHPIPDNVITNAMMTDNSVGNAEMKDNAVGTVELIDASVTLVKAAADLAAFLVPSGAMLDFGGTVAPTGFLLCDGANYLRATYPTLFGAIGSNYGSADGTHFNVPDFRGRVAIGTGAGSGLTSRTIASSGGEETHVLTTTEMPAHTHTYSGTTSSDGAHTHSVDNNLDNLGPSVVNHGLGTGTGNIQFHNTTTTSNGAHTHTYSGTTSSVGSGAPHNNMQPYLVATKIIKI